MAVTTPKKILLLLSLLASQSLVQVVESFPLFLLGKIKTRCLSVTAPQDTVLKVTYDAPGKSSLVRRRNRIESNRIECRRGPPLFWRTFACIHQRRKNRIKDRMVKRKR